MNAFIDPEELVMCPYDKNHSIMKCKLGFHLVKCRKNHQGAAIAVCDYNQEHRIPKPELKYHLETCEDRIAIEARPRALQEENVMSFPITDIASPSDQVWNCLDHPGYDSEIVTEKTNVLRSTAVEKPSVRKQFRAEEQRRMNAIRAPSNSNEYTNQVKSSKPSNGGLTCDAFVDEDKPELSLVERLRRGEKTVYEPTYPEEQWIKKTSRKSKK